MYSTFKRIIGKLISMPGRALGKLDERDWHLYIGTLLLAAGLGFIWWKLALIAPGIIFLYIALRRVRYGNTQQH